MHWNNPQLNLSSLQNSSNIRSCWPIKKCSNKGLLQCSQNWLVFHTKNNLFTAHLFADASHQLLLCDTCPFFFSIAPCGRSYLSAKTHVQHSQGPVGKLRALRDNGVFSNFLKKNPLFLGGRLFWESRFPWFCSKCLINITAQKLLSMNLSPTFDRISQGKMASCFAIFHFKPAVNVVAWTGGLEY